MEDKKKDIFLWSQIKKGDTNAYHTLYDRYINVLFSFGMQYTKDENLIQDAIHDIFVELYRYRMTIAEVVDIKSYLFKTLQRDIFKKLRIQSRNIKFDTINDTFNAIESIEDSLIYDETVFQRNNKLASALTSLTKKQRQALDLRFSDNQSYEEIALILGINLESCRTLIYRSLKELRKKL
jgi:RNA polymerase sigma factor (sigma-70 family)